MPSIEAVLRRALDAIVAHPRLVLAAFVALTGTLATQIPRFDIDASAETLLTRDNVHWQRMQEMGRRFAPREFVLVVYQPKQSSVFSQRSLADIAELTASLRALPRVETVHSIRSAPLWQPGEDVAGDVGQATLEHRRFDATQLAAMFRGHPVYEDLLINRAQTAVALQVLFKPATGAENPDRLEAIRKAEILAMRQIVEPYEARADLYLGGVHVLAFQLVEIIEHDLVVFGGAIVLMIALVLLALFRRLRWVAIPLACCACSVAGTVGLLGLLGLKTTVVSSSFIALQLILTLALVIHLIVQYRESAAAHPDWSQPQLVTDTVRRKAGPCFYAGLTNVVGFASLMFSGLKPVSDFGWMMSIALFLSIGASLVLFPALLALLPRERQAPLPALLVPVLVACAGLARDRPRVVVAVSLVALGAAAAGLGRLQVENSFINYFRADTQVHRELAFIDAEMGGSTPLDVVWTVPRAQRKPDLVLSAEGAQTMQAIHKTLERHEAIGKVLSPASLTALARQLNAGRPLTEYELTALYWSMDRQLRADLVGAFFTPQTAQARFSTRVIDTTPGLDRARLLADLRAELAALVPADSFVLTNLFVLYQDLLQQLYESQILTLGVAFGVLTATMLVIFRSLTLALIGITPNLLSTLIVLGLMGWLGIALDLMTIMIAAVALGITVDDTIHYIHRYREERRAGAGPEALPRTHASVGTALLYTSVVVILGLALLAFSDFVPSLLFGLLTGLAMALAVLFDLTVLPVLLRRFADPVQLPRARTLKQSGA